MTAYRKVVFVVTVALGLAIIIGLLWSMFSGRFGSNLGAPYGNQTINRILPNLGDMRFELVDHEGQAVSPQSLTGRPTLIFFGFTWCPDICPTTLNDISIWLNELGPDAERLNAVFVSVDPARDTPEALGDYIAPFHKSIRAWTGSDENIAKVAKAFHVFVERVPLSDGDYTINHTATVFLFDASGAFRSTIDFHEPREVAVPKIRLLL